MSGLSDSLVYSPKPRAVSAMKHRVNIPPINGQTFSPGDTIQLAIPCGNRGEFLNTRQSYLKLTIRNKDATAANKIVLDGSAHAILRLLEVTYGSNVLEYVDQYNALHRVLVDATGDSLQMAYGGSVTEGMDMSTSRKGAEIQGNEQLTVCLPLMSGVLGTMQHKYIPIGDMVRNHLRLNLTLANQARGRTGVNRKPPMGRGGRRVRCGGGQA